MSTEVVNSYNIFVDTERNINATSDGNSIMLSLNQTPITCSSNQYIRMTLQSFSMYKSFTNVNKNNNVFKITHDGATPQADLALYLPSLDYTNLNALATQFANTLGNQLAADIGGGITFTIPTTAPNALTPEPATSTDNIITFTIKFSANHNLTQLLVRTLVEDGDSFEVLGTNRIRADDGTPAWDALNSLFTDVTTDPTEVRVKCLYNAQLSSQQNMYLRTDINNTNIQTESFVAGSTDITSASSLSSSNILGRMVIDNKFVNFTTGTQMEYFVSLTTKQITHMRLYITDSHGRDIPPNVQTLNNPAQSPVYPALTAQSTLGNRSWEGVIKVDIVQFMGGQNHKLESAPVVHSVPPRFGTEPLNKFDYGESGYADVNFSKMRLK